METQYEVNSFENILAKSDKNGGLSLLSHTQHIVTTMKAIANGFYTNFDVDIAQKGAILHDLGKAHPYFQKKISDYKPKSVFEKMRFQKFKHRHEISSLCFLPAFPKKEWNALIEMVVAHHKSIEKDKNSRGILDLSESCLEDEVWIANHLQNWEDWFPVGQDIINHFGYDCKNITKQEAEEALLYVLNYCQSLKNGWSPWRGLLKSADHYASAFNNKSEERMSNLFQNPDLEYYKDKNRVSNLYPLSKINTNDERRHTIVVAPTGAGKTDFLLKRTKGRIFYILPFQASINAMYDRFRETITPQEGIRLQHGTSRIKVKDNYAEQLEQGLVGASIKVITPHQLAGIIFGIKNFESIMLDIEGCDVILDEIHTYSDVSQSMVIEIVKVLLFLNCNIHIGTATMPTPLYDILLKLLGGQEKVYEVSLSKKALIDFDRHKIYKHNSRFEDEDIQTIVKQSIAQQEKILIVFNTVKSAQAAYKNILEDEAFENVPKMLIHSRFRRQDRVRLEQKLKEVFNTSTKACLVISTQVVEVSLDISFDRMITQAAPLDSLVQRFGRINRKRTKETIGKYRPIHILEPTTNTLPYRKEIVKQSFEILPDDGHIFHETFVQGYMDKIYKSISPRPIDVHLKFINGQFTLKKLTDNSKSILIEALEIDGATCILESDREKYINAYSEERKGMEIPISFKTLRFYKDKYDQLDEYGSHPFVVPQSLEEYNLYGLILVEPDNFL